MRHSTSFSSVLINVYWFYIFVEFIIVLGLINSHELFEMAATDFTAGNWSDAPCFRALCQRFLASFEENSCLQILFCFHMGPINETLEVTPRKKLRERSQVIAVASQRPPLFPTIVAITKCCVETDSCGLRKMRRNIIVLEPSSPVAYFHDRNIDAVFRMKGTLPTTCFVPQMFFPRPPTTPNNL
jgi:hypothetical protein